MVRPPLEQREYIHDQLTRRSVAKGAAWSIPAISIATAAPALAASPPAECPSTAQENAGVPALGSTFSVGSTPSYSTAGGSLASVSMTVNFNMFASCYSGSVSYYWNDFSSGPATLTTTSGTVYSSTSNTLGQVSSGGALTGAPTSATWMFANSGGSCGSLNGATANIPFRFVYTAPDGSTHNLQYRISFTLSKGCTLLTSNPSTWSSPPLNPSRTPQAQTSPSVAID